MRKENLAIAGSAAIIMLLTTAMPAQAGWLDDLLEAVQESFKISLGGAAEADEEPPENPEMLDLVKILRNMQYLDYPKTQDQWEWVYTNAPLLTNEELVKHTLGLARYGVLKDVNGQERCVNIYLVPFISSHTEELMVGELYIVPDSGTYLSAGVTPLPSALGEVCGYEP